jgi:hypothetical protein
VVQPATPEFRVQAEFNMSGYVEVEDHTHTGGGYKVRSECKLKVGHRVPGAGAYTYATVATPKERQNDWTGKDPYTLKTTYDAYIDGDALEFRIVIEGEVKLETSRGDMWVRGEAKSAGDPTNPSLQGSVTAYSKEGGVHTPITDGTPTQSFGP